MSAAGTVSHLLDAWRASERHWSELQPDDPGYGAALLEVARTWVDYQAATDRASDELILIADESMTYVAASANVCRILGYTPAELIGRRISDLSLPPRSSDPDDGWEASQMSGRQGRYRLARKDGSCVDVEYRALAHTPAPGLLASWVRPALEASEPPI